MTDDTSPSEGHNTIGVTKEVFDKHLAIIGNLEAEKAALQLRIKRARKLAKADGIRLKNFDAMRALADLPRAELQDNLGHNAWYLKWLQAPVGVQLSMFDDEIDDGTGGDDEAAFERLVAEAKGAGWRAGMTGSAFETECPHDANTPQGQAWIGAYRDAQAKAVEALKGVDTEGKPS